MFKEIAEQYYEEARAIREDLHRHPELSYNEHRTAELIEKKLTEYGVDSMERMFDTGVVALIHGAKGPGKCIGIRADIDALPVNEETGVAFASENPGVMHACGHDIHVTNLLIVARILCENRDKFRGTVKLIFQPAEEAASPDNPHAGAWNMVRCGCLENPRVDAMIGLHNNPSASGHGTFGLRKGVCTSGFDLYRFDVYGKTAHGSQPHVGNDAILAVSQLIVLLQQVVSRNIDPLKTGILSVGTIQGGTRVNIIPEYATAGGCFRYYDNDTAKVMSLPRPRSRRSWARTAATTWTRQPAAPRTSASTTWSAASPPPSCGSTPAPWRATRSCLCTPPSGARTTTSSNTAPPAWRPSP